jgi:hypothetical protein
VVDNVEMNQFTAFRRRTSLCESHELQSRVPELVLRSAVEFCYSCSCKDLNCRAETLVDFYLCGSLSNSGFLPICIIYVEIWNLSKFVKLFMDLFEFGWGTYPPFGNVTHSVVCLQPIFSFSKVLDVFPLDPI